MFCYVRPIKLHIVLRYVSLRYVTLYYVLFMFRVMCYVMYFTLQTTRYLTFIIYYVTLNIAIYIMCVACVTSGYVVKVSNRWLNH